MILGMCIKLWCSTQFGPYKDRNSGQGWWDDNVKVRGISTHAAKVLADRQQLALTWSIITLATIGLFLAAQISLIAKSGDDAMEE